MTPPQTQTELDKAIDEVRSYFNQASQKHIWQGWFKRDIEILLLAAKHVKEVENNYSTLITEHNLKMEMLQLTEGALRLQSEKLKELEKERDNERTGRIIAETTCDELRPLIEKNQHLNEALKLCAEENTALKNTTKEALEKLIDAQNKLSHPAVQAALKPI